MDNSKKKDEQKLALVKRGRPRKESSEQSEEVVGPKKRARKESLAIKVESKDTTI